MIAVNGTPVGSTGVTGPAGAPSSPDVPAGPADAATDRGSAHGLTARTTDRVLEWASAVEGPGPGRDGVRYLAYCNDGRRVRLGPVPPGRTWREEVGLIALDDANRSRLAGGTLLPREYEEGRLRLTLVHDPASGRYAYCLDVDRNAPLSQRVRRGARPRLGPPDWLPVACGWVRPLVDAPTATVERADGGPWAQERGDAGHRSDGPRRDHRSE